MLGADQGQIALGTVGAVLGGFQLALESSYPGHALLGHTLLFAEERINYYQVDQVMRLNKSCKNQAHDLYSLNQIEQSLSAQYGIRTTLKLIFTPHILWIISYLFRQLPLVDVDLLGGLFERVLEQDDVLLVLLALDHDLLQLTLLLAEDLDGLSVPPLLLIHFQFHVLDAGLKFADDALATDDSVGLDLFKADRDILEREMCLYISNLCS